ncbi:uncharacterized protein Dwil_GK16342 [Drosophila willistoni]|uniref:Uncharacterized protein n=1 Tax=Drosophila willistoni TaxID=7260 RepID=B4N1N1_DROWI|nr:ATP-dependent RNA helicase DED1 [Drosophila willistoni]EDW78270.1 uncharacterized protein Dwil_GK16342 [Drosophila willistoni]
MLLSTGIVGNRWISFALWIVACLSAVSGQAGTVTWGAGNGAGANGAGVGAWSNSQTGGMHPPGSLGSNDPQFSYGYAGVDSRGPYGGSGGNGGYYVSGTDEHGRPFSYNGGGQIPPPGYPGRNDYYGYRGAASMTTSVTLLGVALSIMLSTTMLCRRS